jgi:hypothetical protein
MTIRPPYEFPFDPPSPNGEMMIAVADPIGSAPSPATFYLARRFNFSEGNYIIEIGADDAATLWIGTDQLNSRIIASPTLSVPAISPIYIPQGSYRLDVILQNLSPAASPCYFSMVIRQGENIIYASSAEGWLLDESPIADDDLPPPEDYRFKLPMFTLLPNWRGGITELLSWTTDIMDSETDAEQRRSVRRNARRSFRADFLRQYQYRDRLDTFFVGIGSAEFMMPLWHEAVKLVDGLDMAGLGITFPDGELKFREFREGDLVFVNSNDPDNYDILQVGEMEENRFSWAFPPPRSWPPGTRIYPMRTARILVQPPRMSNITDTVSTTQVQFDLSEPYTIAASWGDNVGGQPYFRFHPDRRQTIEVGYDRRSYTLDNNSGVPIVTDHGRYTGTMVQTKLRLFGRADAFAFRQFLQAARGRAKHFFAPTFMQDVVLKTYIEADSSEIWIMPQGFTAYMLRPQPIRLMLAFIFRNNAQTLYRTIINTRETYKTNPGTGLPTNPLQVNGEILTLDNPMPEVRAEDLHRISFIVETRFDQDQFELFHPTNQQEVVDASLVLRMAKNPRTGNPT